MSPLRNTLLWVAAATAMLLTTTAAVKDTSYHCYGHGSWSDVCRYKNLCFRRGPEVPVFINDDPQKHNIPNTAIPIRTSTKLFVKLKQPGANRDVPMHWKRVGAETMTASWVEDNPSKVKWVDEPIWIPSYFMDLKNVWFYSSRILPLFTAHYYRDMFKLPAMKNVYIPKPKDNFPFDFHFGLLNLTVTSSTNVYWQGDNPWDDLAPESHTLCFKEAVLLGANMYGFPDQLTAFAFRDKAYKKYGIPIVEAQGFPPPNVTVLDRNSKASRHIGNYGEMMELMESYGVEPERVMFGERYHGIQTFEDQVRKMSQTGLLVSMHGAGLLNEVFLPPGAAVIEIFPVHLKHVLYERIAAQSGVYHFKVYTREFTTTFHDVHPVYKDRECEAEQSLLYPETHYCWIEVKNAVIVTPMVEFEVAFVHAMDSIGHRLRLKGFTTPLLRDKSWPKEGVEER